MSALEIATVGSRVEPLIASLRQIPFDRLVLLHAPPRAKEAERVAGVAAALRAETEVVPVAGPELTSLLARVSDICVREASNYDRIFANVTSGDTPLCCQLVFAAVANGIEAISVEEDHTHVFPPGLFPYWRFLSEPKERILAAIEGRGGRVESLTDLGSVARLDASALAYHLRDATHGRGLADLGLVRLMRDGSVVHAELTNAGLLALSRRRVERARGA